MGTIHYSLNRHTLRFKFEAGTSRGVMTSKDTWYLKIWNQSNPTIVGIGEAAPLKGLSIEYSDNFESIINEKVKTIFSNISFENDQYLRTIDDLPSMKFAIETALLDLNNGGSKIIFDTDFTKGKASIEINGLVWMGSLERMKKEVHQKVNEGYKCIKIKIGALDFEHECSLLEYIRAEFPRDIEIRTDANGGFTPQEAMKKLNRLAKYGIHSIEQPIKPGQWRELKFLCDESPIPIALDEELIGILKKESKIELLNEIDPDYIILKPTLLGGLGATSEWIEIAEQKGIGWWLTSALESNIGLNAISQYASTLDLKSFPQGLGTGQLYHNNIDSSLVIKSGSLWYDTSFKWGTV